MFDNNCLEIFDKDGELISIISCFKSPLTEKQMRTLMKLFKGYENSECVWLFQDNVEGCKKGQLMKEFDEYINQNYAFIEVCPHCNFEDLLFNFKQEESYYQWNSALKLGFSKYVVLICSKCGHPFPAQL